MNSVYFTGEVPATRFCRAAGYGIIRTRLPLECLAQLLDGNIGIAALCRQLCQEPPATVVMMLWRVMPWTERAVAGEEQKEKIRAAIFSASLRAVVGAIQKMTQSTNVWCPLAYAHSADWLSVNLDTLSREALWLEATGLASGVLLNSSCRRGRRLLKSVPVMT